jgi:hypothetical protein
MAETTMKSDDFTRGADQAKPVTVRFAPEIAVRLDADAQTRGASRPRLCGRLCASTTAERASRPR